MGVEDDVHVGAEDLAGPLDRLVDVVGSARSGSVLEAEGVEGDSRIEDLAEDLLVEVGVVGGGVVAVGQAHHRDGDLVLQAGVMDGLAAVDQVVDVVEGVEVADRRHSMLLEHLGMELDDVARLAVKSDDIDTPGQGLEVGVRSGDPPELVHHGEGVLIRVEVEGLEAGATACLEMLDASFPGGLDGRHEVLGEDTGAIDGLEAVAEGRAHEVDLFLCHVNLSFQFLDLE